MRRASEPTFTPAFVLSCLAVVSTWHTQAIPNAWEP